MKVQAFIIASSYFAHQVRTCLQACFLSDRPDQCRNSCIVLKGFTYQKKLSSEMILHRVTQPAFILSVDKIPQTGGSISWDDDTY